MSLSLEQIDEYIDALLSNAADLVNEADVLLSSKAYARSFALAHLAREEIAKSLMLQAAGVRLLAGKAVHWKDLMKRLRDHKAKLRLENVQNAMLLSAYGQEEDAGKALGFAAPIAKYRNDRKNSAMYVGFEEGRIKRPSALVSERQAWRTVALAKLALEQERQVRAALGHLAKRKPIELPSVEADPAHSEKLLDIAKGLGPAYRRLLDHLAGASDPLQADAKGGGTASDVSKTRAS